MRSALESPTALDPVNFTALGPQPLISGVATGGRTNVIVTHPTDPTIAWIGTDGGGVWKTEDGGLSWVNISDGFFKRASVGGLAVKLADLDYF